MAWIRGDLDEFILALDEALRPRSPGGRSLSAGERLRAGQRAATKNHQPAPLRHHPGLVAVTWPRVQFEVSPDEAGVTTSRRPSSPPPLSGFGLPDPHVLVATAMRDLESAWRSRRGRPDRADRNRRAAVGPIVSCSSLTPASSGDTSNWTRRQVTTWQFEVDVERRGSRTSVGTLTTSTSPRRRVSGPQASWSVRIVQRDDELSSHRECRPSTSCGAGRRVQSVLKQGAALE